MSGQALQGTEVPRAPQRARGPTSEGRLASATNRAGARGPSLSELGAARPKHVDEARRLGSPAPALRRVRSAHDA
eukprot:9433466-Pyramimonas_sp.AAC.1